MCVLLLGIQQGNRFEKYEVSWATNGLKIRRNKLGSFFETILIVVEIGSFEMQQKVPNTFLHKNVVL